MSLLSYRVGGCSLKENWCKSWGGYGKFHTFQFGLANGVERVKGEGGDMVDFCLEKILYNSINGDFNWWTFFGCGHPDNRGPTVFLSFTTHLFYKMMQL